MAGNVRPHVNQVVTLTGLDSFIPCFASLEEAQPRRAMARNPRSGAGGRPRAKPGSVRDLRFRMAADKLGLDLVWRGCDIDPEYAEQTGQG